MRKSPIKLHWSSSKPNFGDRLSPMLVEALAGRPVEHASIKKCDLVALGSLLQRLDEHFWTRRVHIWGSGFIEPRPVRHTRHFVHAVRGCSSRSVLGAEEAAVGDPGLLVDRLLGDRIKSAGRCPLAVIPHYKDKGDPHIARLLELVPGAVEVDIFDEPEQVLGVISGAEMVVSSAMHGLIVADSLGVPNAWIELSGGVRGKGFKFADYYSVFGINPEPLSLQPDGLLQRIEEAASSWSRPGIEAVKDKLMDSFPDL